MAKHKKKIKVKIDNFTRIGNIAWLKSNGNKCDRGNVKIESTEEFLARGGKIIKEKKMK